MSHLNPQGIRKNLIASLVVFIVAIPLSLGIALASGADPAKGLITAIIGGLVVGLLSGAPLVVSGPAAGLTAFVFQLVQEFGIQGLAIITIICGFFQLGMGTLKVGRIFTWVPKAVLEGMLCAIGFIILVGQLHILMGQTSVPSSTFQAIVLLPNVLSSTLESTGIKPVFTMGLIALGIQILWPRLFSRWKWFPAALPAVIIVTFFSQYWEMPRVEIASLSEGIRAHTQGLSQMDIGLNFYQYLFPGFALALIASAETLLTARAVETYAKELRIPNQTQLNRELLAQGTANSLAGLLGGLPLTGVMVRSAVNIEAGGTSRLSTIFHGIWVGFFVILLPSVLSMIPLTALGAILVLTGYKLLNVSKLAAMIRQDRNNAIIWIATALGIVGTDLLSGLGIGIGFSFFLNWGQIKESIHTWYQTRQASSSR